MTSAFKGESQFLRRGRLHEFGNEWREGVKHPKNFAALIYGGPLTLLVYVIRRVSSHSLTFLLVTEPREMDRTTNMEMRKNFSKLRNSKLRIWPNYAV